MVPKIIEIANIITFGVTVCGSQGFGVANRSSLDRLGTLESGAARLAGWGPDWRKTSMV